MARMIGTINGRASSSFLFRGKTGTFDATTLDLAKSLAALGAKPGEKVRANFGGNSVAGMNNYIVEEDGRTETGNLWVSRVW